MKAKNSLVAGLIAGLAVFAVPASAFADTEIRYDRKIEEAAIKALQGKLGDIRGTLEAEAEDFLFPPLEMRGPDGSKTPMFQLEELGQAKGYIISLL